MTSVDDPPPGLLSRSVVLHACRFILTALWIVACCALMMVRAAAGAEAWSPIERQLPPPGITISAEDRAQLDGTLAELRQRFDAWKKSAAAEALEADSADVEIYIKAVATALENSEFYQAQDVEVAQGLIADGKQRLEELAAGRRPWGDARGLLVRGYRSDVDGSAQPYGLVIPDALPADRKAPLYVWLHGRNDKLTDLNFIHEHQRKPGQLKFDDAIVLHPFGRSCLGWKSTAEIDVLEAVESVCRRYAIDRDRIVPMGFSMGGAGAWHMGAHYADRWAGVHAGAGFVDVARYTRLAAADYPPEYEQKLWGVYDVPDYVRNLFNLPVVAYSGEVDKQKDAADFMAETFQSQGHTLVHLIGPGMGHKYADPQWQEVVTRMRAAAEKGRDNKARAVSLQTRTLRYSRMRWVQALGLEEHWRDARIDANYATPDRLEISTKNVTRFAIDPPSPLKSLKIDGQMVAIGEARLRFARQSNQWTAVSGTADNSAIRKSPGLQGPIDDVFLEPFLVVLPSGKSLQPAVQRWVDFELAHFQKRWQVVYRGGLRMKRDVDVTADDIARFHLVAWGDPASNTLIGRTADQLPIRWTESGLAAGSRNFGADGHVPLLIYPNPLNPARYLVLNSGPTHREAHDRTNSLQNPKLPDWAIVDVTQAPDAEHPGRIVAADFFDESWQLHAGN